MFPGEKYLQKSKKLGKIIKFFNMPPFIPKNKSEKNDTSKISAIKATKKIGGAQKKTEEVRDAFDGAWGTILAASNFDRIEIVYDTYLEVSTKELTRIGRAKEEPTETINLNLDSPVVPEIKKVLGNVNQ